MYFNKFSRKTYCREFEGTLKHKIQFYKLVEFGWSKCYLII